MPYGWLLAAFLALIVLLGIQVAGATKAWAAGDEIDSFTIEYVMTPEGVLRAKETIVYRFGDDSGRHGIERYFITREPYDDTEDAVFRISNITVETSDGVSNQFSQRTDEAKGGREEQLRLRIGDPDETISARHGHVRDQLRRRAARCARSPTTTSSTGTPPVSSGTPPSNKSTSAPRCRAGPGVDLLRRGGWQQADLLQPDQRRQDRPVQCEQRARR